MFLENFTYQAEVINISSSPQHPIQHSLTKPVKELDGAL